MPDTDEPAATKETTSTAVPAHSNSEKLDEYRILQSPDTYITVIVTVVIVTLLKRTAALLGKDFIEKTFVKIFFEWSGPLVAMGLALIPGLWDDFHFPLNMVIAAPAGFFAERVYKSVLSRVMPAGWILTSDAPLRQTEPGQPPAPTPAPAPVPPAPPAPEAPPEDPPTSNG